MSFNQEHVPEPVPKQSSQGHRDTTSELLEDLQQDADVKDVDRDKSEIEMFLENSSHPVRESTVQMKILWRAHP